MILLILNLLLLLQGVYTEIDHAAKLIEWLLSEGGFVSEKIRLRKEGDIFGWFAVSDIPQNSLLFRIPPEIILNTPIQDIPVETPPLVCGTVRMLARELKKGDASRYAPYIRYLLDTQVSSSDPDSITTSIPSAWSDEGRELINRLVYGDEEGDSILPPEYPTEWLTIDWYEDCEGSDDPMEEFAALQVLARAWDSFLVPVYDMINHRNGEYLNTKSNDIELGQSVRVRASKDIKDGDQIYHSYNLCSDCDLRRTIYGTPEIFRDYGFVEQFPQSWIFSDVDIAFRIQEVVDEDGNVKLEVYEWIEGKGGNDEKSIKVLQNLLNVVVQRKEHLFTFRDKNIPNGEWNIMKEYVDALEVAVKTALDAARNDHVKECKKQENLEEDECIKLGTCKMRLILKRRGSNMRLH